MILPPGDKHRRGQGRAPWPPKLSEAERRRMNCELLYDLEMELLKIGWDECAYLNDEERDLFRFRNGRFALTREHAD